MEEEKQGQQQTPLDYESAKGMAPEEAAFFYRGPSETIAEGVVFFPRQGNCTAFLCDGQILFVDTTPQWYAPRTVEDLRKNYSQAPVETIVYTHGHIDHVTGAETFLADAERLGHPRPRIIGHRDIAHRFDRWLPFLGEIELGPQQTERFGAELKSQITRVLQCFEHC